MYNNRTITALLLLLALISGCDNRPQVAPQAAQYDKNGISFSYPGDWKVSDEGSSDAMRYVIIEGPQHGLFLAQVYPADEALSLQEFAEWFSRESSKSVPFGEVGAITLNGTEKQFGGSRHAGIREEFSIVLFGQTVPHTREYYSNDAFGRVAFIMGQSPNEDQPATQPGIDMIMNSFALTEIRQKKGELQH